MNFISKYYKETSSTKIENPRKTGGIYKKKKSGWTAVEARGRHNEKVPGTMPWLENRIIERRQGTQRIDEYVTRRKTRWKKRTPNVGAYRAVREPKTGRKWVKQEKAGTKTFWRGTEKAQEKEGGVQTAVWTR